jgi:alpha-1,6-mannosyltransferase
MVKGRLLTGIALVCASYLSTSLIVLGLDKFYYVLAGGRKFATFPDLSSQLGIGLSYFVLMVLYLLWFFGEKQLRESLRFIDILKGAAVFLLLAFASYPLGDDVYLYMHAGLMNLSGANPFITRAGAFTTELTPFVDWGQTSTYGPVSQLLFTLSAAIIPVSPILAIYVYKSFCLGLHIFNGYGIWRISQGKQRGKIATAYLLNPLLLMEQVGSGHVDVLVSTSLIVFAACLFKQRYKGAAIALWGGFLSKTIPLIWMPLMTIFLVRQRRWWQLAGIALLSLGLIAILWYTALPGFAAWRSLLNPGVAGQYQSSPHVFPKFVLDLTRIFAPELISLSQEKQILLKLGQYLLIGFAAFYAWVCLRALRRPTYEASHLVEDMGWVTMVLLLYATPWLMPWYASALLTIAALIPGAQLFGLTSLAFGLSSSAQYWLQGHDALKSLMMVGLPTLVLIVGARLSTWRSLEKAVALPATPTGKRAMKSVR